MHTLTIENVSDDFLETFVALAKAAKAKIFTQEDDEDWEAEMQEAIRQAEDIIANPQNYPSYKTIAELRKALNED